MLRVNLPFTNYILYISLVKNNLEYFTSYEVHIIYALDYILAKSKLHLSNDELNYVIIWNKIVYLKLKFYISLMCTRKF